LLDIARWPRRDDGCMNAQPIRGMALVLAAALL